MDFFSGSGVTGAAAMDAAVKLGAPLRFILVEVGDYFEDILLKRIKKLLFSPEWQDGKPKRQPTKDEARLRPAIIKCLHVESYEDALGNIAFGKEDQGQALMNLEGYKLRYMLDFETRESATLLNLDQLRKPFSYTLDIKDGQITRACTVDLPETFAYLIGLTVERRSVQERKGSKTTHRYLVHRGKTHDLGATVAVLWRDIEGWKQDDFQAEREWLAKDKDMKNILDDVTTIYVNGTSTVEKAESLDPLFKRLLFAPVAPAID
jgi:adenine-specific DNA-methyltransferase